MALECSLRFVAQKMQASVINGQFKEWAIGDPMENLTHVGSDKWSKLHPWEFFFDYYLQNPSNWSADASYIDLSDINDYYPLTLNDAFSNIVFLLDGGFYHQRIDIVQSSIKALDQESGIWRLLNLRIYDAQDEV